MKKEWIPATLLTIVCLVLLNGAYTALVWGVAQLTPQRGLGERVTAPNGELYYANVAQKFTEDRYFWGRPSAVDYNAAGSGGSNKGPSNPEYLQAVSDRIDSFLVHNPAVTRAQIPAELVTASGSGLDPDLSPASAAVQVARVAAARGMDVQAVQRLVMQRTDTPAGGLAPAHVNVLRLNLQLDALQNQNR